MSTAEAFGNFAPANMIQEATAFKTVKAGQYDGQINKVYEFNADEGWARVGAKVAVDGAIRGSVFFRVQWKEARGKNGKLKGSCKLYAQLLKALYPTKTADELATVDAQTLLDDSMKFVVGMFVSEYYVVPDASNPYGSSRVYPKTTDEIADVLKRGGKAKNDVLTISPKR